jgi:RimJ/RimL family protein N-acetyltransferase
MTNNIKINTERLRLRSVRLDDAEAIFKYRSDSITNQYKGWIPESLNDVHSFINKVSPEINIVDTWYQFVITKKENNELIGDFIRNVD